MVTVTFSQLGHTVFSTVLEFTNSLDQILLIYKIVHKQEWADNELQLKSELPYEGDSGQQYEILILWIFNFVGFAGSFIYDLIL